MRNIYLILHNVKKLIIYNKATFFIVFFSLTVTTFGILFYSGYIYNDAVNVSDVEGDFIEIYLDDSASCDDIKEVVANIEKEQMVRSIIAAEEDPISIDGSYPVVGEYNVKYSQMMLTGTYFDRNEKNSLAVIPEYSVSELVGYDESPINKVLEVGDSELVISGVISFLTNDYVVVPIDFYLENLETRFISCTYQSTISHKDEVISYLESNHHVKQFSVSSPPSVISRPAFWMQFGQILLIFIVAVINLFTIIYFWIMRNRRMYNIYSVCGGSRRKINVLIIGQSFVIILSGIIAGGLLFLALSRLFEKFDLVDRNVFSFYLFVMIIVLFITVVFSVITTLKANKNNEIYHIKE